MIFFIIYLFGIRNVITFLFIAHSSFEGERYMNMHGGSAILGKAACRFSPDSVAIPPPPVASSFGPFYALPSYVVMSLLSLKPVRYVWNGPVKVVSDGQGCPLSEVWS